jgi:hypothetical protein
MAHGPTLVSRPDTPAKPSTVMDERAFSAAAYQRDWVLQRTGERGVNQPPVKWLAVAAYQTDWTIQRTEERTTGRREPGSADGYGGS